ncbi:MAG: hypothetical protein ACOYXW_06530 [Actinomycetota bacterium]
MSRKRIALLAALPLVLGACGGDSEPAATPTAADTAAAEDTATGEDTATAGAVTVDVAEVSDLGEVLVDGEGRTLYMFDPDAQGESTCYDQCEQNWPPLVSDGTASVGEGADDSKVGSVERRDGSQQVTYNGWPLYYFAADQAPGDSQGQGVNDVWWVLDADGEPVRSAGTGY